MIQYGVEWSEWGQRKQRFFDEGNSVDARAFFVECVLKNAIRVRFFSRVLNADLVEVSRTEIGSYEEMVN
jgi:hypothetical protein